MLMTACRGHQRSGCSRRSAPARCVRGRCRTVRVRWCPLDPGRGLPSSDRHRVLAYTPPAFRGKTRAATRCASGWASTTIPSTTPSSWPSCRWAFASRDRASRGIFLRGPSVHRCGTNGSSNISTSSWTLLIGRYAQARYLGDRQGKNLTETVRGWRSYETSVLPLPHPSPRNRRWLARNPWFAKEVLPVLRRRLRRAQLR